MEPIFMKFTDYGLIGIIMAFLIYDVFFLQKKILSIVENNTAVMTKVGEIIHDLQTAVCVLQTAVCNLQEQERK